MGSIFLKEGLKDKLISQTISLETVAKDAKDYHRLKSLKHTNKELQKTIAQFKKYIGSNKMKRNGNGFHLEYEKISNKALDQLMKVFFERGHSVVFLDIQKVGNNFDVTVKVRP